MNKWTKALQEALAGECDIVPKGWHNMHEWAEKMDLSEPQTAKRLALLIRAGKMEVRKFRVLSTSGLRTLPVPYYRLK